MEKEIRAAIGAFGSSSTNVTKLTASNFGRGARVVRRFVQIGGAVWKAVEFDRYDFGTAFGSCSVGDGNALCRIGIIKYKAWIAHLAYVGWRVRNKLHCLGGTVVYCITRNRTEA